jgi:hypothetical protein
MPRGDSSQADADHGRPERSNRMPILADTVDGVIGVDTHRDTLAAAALSPIGGVLQSLVEWGDIRWLCVL